MSFALLFVREKFFNVFMDREASVEPITKPASPLDQIKYDVYVKVCMLVFGDCDTANQIQELRKDVSSFVESNIYDFLPILVRVLTVETPKSYPLDEKLLSIPEILKGRTTPILKMIFDNNVFPTRQKIHIFFCLLNQLVSVLRQVEEDSSRSHYYSTLVARNQFHASCCWLYTFVITLQIQSTGQFDRVFVFLNDHCHLYWLRGASLHFWRILFYRVVNEVRPSEIMWEVITMMKYFVNQSIHPRELFFMMDNYRAMLNSMPKRGTMPKFHLPLSAPLAPVPLDYQPKGALKESNTGGNLNSLPIGADWFPAPMKSQTKCL